MSLTYETRKAMTSRMFFTTLFSAVGAAGIVLFGSDAIEANVKPTISTEAQPYPLSLCPISWSELHDHDTLFRRCRGKLR